ncbi:MAG: ribonuclease H-like domain-containing protein [Polyangiaceae bacterium]|nr:ribonuclease H-like domain-containing protein [Polyangiaceae bacterium]
MAGSTEAAAEGVAEGEQGSSSFLGGWTAPNHEASDALAELRRRMQAVIGGPEGAPVSRAHGSLPFDAVERPEGRLWLRQVTLPFDFAVGRAAAQPARAAAPELLALLGLDASLSAAPPERALYFDTETTGLGVGAGTVAFLIGVGWFGAAGLTLEQLFVREPADEPAALGYLRERAEGASLLISFNGKAFDWPLLLDRYVMNQLPPPAARPHLDLLHVARRLHRARLGSCRLQVLEREVLGFTREGDVEGAEIAARYAHFLRSGDEGALTQVVQHNLWDVASMVALVGLYGEPLEALHPLDLVGAARTFQRGNNMAAAQAAAERALARGAGAPGLELTARLAKARGDRARALRDFEALTREVDDPAVRLELAKLYEHHARDPLRALGQVEAGTGEEPRATEKRRARLTKKLDRQLAEAAARIQRARRAAAH